MIKLHPQVKELWEREGCEPLRYDYSLNPESLVLDIGGSIGNFSHGITGRYGCYVAIYEPIESCFKACQSRFKDNPKVKVIRKAVHAIGGPLYVNLESETVSIAKLREPYEVIDGVDVVDITYRHIDLLKLNIEGSEYDVLERLTETSNIKNVDNIQVQFHILNGDSFLRRYKIQQKLAETHTLVWNHEFCWESWMIKK